MPNPTLGFRPDPQDMARLEDLQARFGLSRADTVRECIRRVYAAEFPAPCIGYVALDRRGDLDEDTECIECGQPLSKQVFVAVMADGTIEGPLCEQCASSQ